jgi:hypothetical protein
VDRSEKLNVGSGGKLGEIGGKLGEIGGKGEIGGVRFSFSASF